MKTPNEELLFQHLHRYISIDRDQFSKIRPYFELQHLKKKEVLLEAQQACHHLYFVADGCLRGYFIDENGIEKTHQFALESWWITDFPAFHHQRLSDTCVQAVEASAVFSISHDGYLRLLSDHPVMESYFRQMWEIAYGATVNRVKYIFNHSKEEIFYRFREQYPEFANRVPQYMLATFLGLTPEYLSKLRGKKLS